MKLKVNRKAATENYFEFDKRARTLKRNCVRLHSVYLLGKYFLSSVCAKYDFNFLNLLILQSIVQNCRQKLTNLRSRPNGDRDYFFIKWANPGLFFVYFRSFKQTLFFLQQINVKKMSCPSSIQHQDSNPRPSECESPPITTRPGTEIIFKPHFGS